jgi:hypothetical protein
MYRRHAVLYSDPKDLNFLDLFQDALDTILENHRYHFVRTKFETATNDLMRHIYTEQRRRITLSLALDMRLQLRYFEIESELPEETDKVASWLEELLPVAPLSELQETAREMMQDDPDALVRLALGVSDSSDPISLQLLRDGMTSPDELVRFRAAEAASLTRWPELRSDLKRLLDDSSPEVRKMASHAVKACGIQNG